MNRRLSTTVGVVLGVVGLGALALPALTAILPANDAVLLALGLVLVLGGVREVWRRRHTEPAYAETADTEEPVELAAPGQAFDRRLRRLSNVRFRNNLHQRVRERVLGVAATTLERRVGYTEAAAQEALREGTWTEDPFAVALFTDRGPDTGPVSRLREVIRPRSSFQHRVRRAIDELYNLTEEDDRDDHQ